MFSYYFFFFTSLCPFRIPLHWALVVCTSDWEEPVVSGYFFVPVRYHVCSLLLNTCVSCVTLRPEPRSGVKSWPFSTQMAQIPLSPPAQDFIASLWRHGEPQPPIFHLIPSISGTAEACREVKWFAWSSARQISGVGAGFSHPARSLPFLPWPPPEEASTRGFWQRCCLPLLRPPYTPHRCPGPCKDLGCPN